MTRAQAIVLSLLCLVLVACGASDHEQRPAGTAVLQPTSTAVSPSTAGDAATATPTRELILSADARTPTPGKATSGTLEVRVPYAIFSTTPPEDMDECVNLVPFGVVKEGERTLIEGQGRIDCHFVSEPDVPITFHVLLAMDATLSGELLAATASYPSGFLDAYVTLDGTSTQYYEGYPPEAQNPCPEADPCVSPGGEVMPAPLDYSEGSTVEGPWTFVLHLR